jgi:hypothetical protein
MLFVALLSLAGVVAHQNSRVGLPLHYSLANDVPVAPSLPLKSTDEIMDYANAKVTAGLQDTLAQLNLILNLNGTRQGLQLESELAILKSNIMNRLRSDLLNKIDNVKWSRDKDQEETEEERLRFSQTLQLKWEASANEELEKWKRNSLPLWVQKALPVWKGIESQMKKRVEKYTKIVQMK